MEASLHLQASECVQTLEACAHRYFLDVMFLDCMPSAEPALHVPRVMRETDILSAIKTMLKRQPEGPACQAKSVLLGSQNPVPAWLRHSCLARVKAACLAKIDRRQSGVPQSWGIPSLPL